MRKQLNKLKQTKRLSGLTNLSEVTEQIDDILVRTALSSQVEKDHPVSAHARDPQRRLSISKGKRGVHGRDSSLY